MGASEPHLGVREALAIINARAAEVTDDPPFRVGLACSSTPLHLETLLRAHLLERRPTGDVAVEVGLYGDLAASIARLTQEPIAACAVVLEWPDLDPRLGFREPVGATLATPDDVIETARQRLDRIVGRLDELGARCPTALVLPTLDLPTSYSGRSSVIGAVRSRLDLLVAELAAHVATVAGVRMVAVEPSSGRRDLRADIRSGFPYSVEHASALARSCAAVLSPAPPKKGLITDLDDTLWRGLVGEDGPDAVRWDLESGHVHALYQQVLAGLAARGTLVAVASKNDPEVVDEALRRADLVVPAEALFPVEVSWQPKSAAVEDILRTWNVDASDVVFVDDDPMELAEVAARFPGITTVRFPADDANAVVDVLATITDLCWRDDVTPEDALRSTSLRSGPAEEHARASAVDDAAFLRDLQGRITVVESDGWREPRALELVNKTNQFNLNGRRFDAVGWQELCERPGSVVWTIAYEDRFGPRGVISVLTGVRDGRSLSVDCWVLSCRAFSRGIEHHVLRALGERLDVDELVLDFVPTDRNRVVADLVARGRDDELSDLHLIEYR